MPVTSKLPDLYIPPYVAPRETLSRPSASRINRAATSVQEITLTLPGYDQVIPLPYGEDRVSGYWLVRPYLHVGTGHLRFAIAWGWGGEKGIEGVQSIFFNAAILPGTVSVTHYYGTPEQTVDPMLAADIPGFADEYKYLAYTVFSVPPGTIAGFPQQFQIEAVIRGIRVHDPRLPDVPQISAQYWGVRVTATPRDGVSTYPKFYLASLDMRETRGGPSAIGSGTAGATAGSGASNLFDNDPLTLYNSGSGNDVPIVVYYNFGAPITIEEFSLTARSASFSADTVPTALELVYSDDGASWTAIDSHSSLLWSAGETKTYSVNPGGNIRFTKNSALCMADFITRPKEIGGLGKQVTNLEACADRCDELLGTDRRCEIGLTIKHADTADVMMDMFAAYAEVLWSYDDGKVLMVPDAPVEAPAAVLTSDDIVLDSLMIRGTRVINSPTSVTINGRQPTGTAQAWLQRPAPQYLPGVESGEVDDIPSTIEMPGLLRYAEQARKALGRLRRLAHPSRYPVQVFDEGIIFQRGDVVQLPNEKGLVDALVRVLSKEEVAPGLYQLETEHYSDDLYPDDFIPGDSANWPEGTGFFFRGTELPDGYEYFEDADGYPLFGASDTYPAGTITGDGAIDYGVQETSEDGAHGGVAGEGDWIRGPAAPPFGGDNLPDYSALAPDHKHQYQQTGPQTRLPYRRQERIIVKVDGPGEMPAMAECMADGQIISSVLSEVTNYLGRLAAGGPALNAGSSLEFHTNSGLTTNLRPVFVPAGAHSHQDGTTPGQPGPFFGPFPEAYLHEDEDDHTHAATLNFTLNIKRARLAFYEASADAPAQIGLIAIYFGDPVDLAGTGFSLCNGENGTIDLEDFFVERSSVANAGTKTGDHTFSYEGETNTDEHDHEGEKSDYPQRGGYHRGKQSHRHQVTGSGPYRAPGFSVYFIQYTGVIE